MKSSEADNAIRWFDEVMGAIRQRNAILHSLPTESITFLDNGGSRVDGDILVHFPNSGAPWVVTALDSAELLAISDQMAFVISRWRGVMLGLFGDDNDWPLGRPWPEEA